MATRVGVGIPAGGAAAASLATPSGSLQRTSGSSAFFPPRAGCTVKLAASSSSCTVWTERRRTLSCSCSAEQSEPGPSGSKGGKEGPAEGDEDDDLLARVQGIDWRAFRARLVQGSELQLQPRWAHPLVEPEKGCLLIAHPTAFGIRQPYFNQAVIFLFAHDKQGSAGFILNRPTEYKLGQLAGFEKYMPEFYQSPLYMGGDVGNDLTQVIHGISGMEDSKEIIPGVYLGGFGRIKDSVSKGESKASDYRWFLGYCGWRPGQLEREVAHGVWYLASSSKDIVTDQCIKLERPLWRQVLELMGGQYADISKRAYGEI